MISIILFDGSSENECGVNEKVFSISGYKKE